MASEKHSNITEIMKKNTEYSNVLILGGSGFIGRATALAFSNAGAKVTITTTNKNPPPIINARKKIESVKYDVIEDSDVLEELVKDRDIIINLIALVNAHDTSESEKTRKINVLFHNNLLKAIIKTKTNCHIIFSSSQTVYGKTNDNIVDEDFPISPETIYAKQKREAEMIYEDYVKKYNIPVTILRLSNVYGYGAKKSQSVISTFIENIIDDKEIKIFGTGDELRDYIYVDDVATAILAITKVTLTNLIYNCGSQRLYSIKDLTSYLKKITGFKKIVNVPFPNGYARYPGHIILNSKRFIKEARWKPKTNIEKGLKHTFNMYKNNSKT